MVQGESMRGLILLATLIVAGFNSTAYSAISFDANGKFETTFDCPTEWTRGDGSITCSGWTFNRYLDTSCDGSHPTYSAMVRTTANYTEGGGGMGFRQWAGNGKNNISGGIGIVFPSTLSEFWMRWYQRAGSGLSSGLNQGETKTLHIKHGADANALAFGLIGTDQWSYWIQNPVGPRINGISGYGWNSLISDNNWEAVEVHIKADTNGSNGILRAWVNGVLVLNRTDVNNTPSSGGWNGIQFTGNHDIFTNTTCAEFDYDDVVIYSQTPPNTDANGYAFIGPLDYEESCDNTPSLCLSQGDCETAGWYWDGDSCSADTPPSTPEAPPYPTTGIPLGSLLFSESFEDDNWDGWEDGTDSTGTEAGGVVGNALKWTWASSATRPTGFSAIRKDFSQSVDEFVVEYLVKYDTGWRGSGAAYHPHLIHIHTTADSQYQSPADAHGSIYLESIADTGSPYTNYPQVAFQDSQRVNYSLGTPPLDLTASTEDRSTGQCNTPYTVHGADVGTCYGSGTDWWSSFQFLPQDVAIPGGEWVRVTAYIKKNTVSDSVANSDGIVKLWVNDTLTIDSSTVQFFAAENIGTKWSRFLLAPYIGDGSPVEQSVWLDELNVWGVATAGPLRQGAFRVGGLPARFVESSP